MADQLKQETRERLQQHEQQLLDVRDKTQDAEERTRIEDQLKSLQLTLSDLDDMDENTLRQVHDRLGPPA